MKMPCLVAPNICENQAGLSSVHSLKDMYIPLFNCIRFFEYSPIHGNHRPLGFRDLQEREKVLDFHIVRDLHLHPLGMVVPGKGLA
jgi:hypothetical protein